MQRQIMKKYSADDIRGDSWEIHARKRPEMYFGRDVPRKYL